MKISKGVKEKKLLGLVYGVDGIGKSSFGAQFPNPLFVGPEKGTSFLNVARVEDIKTWKSFVDAIDEIIKELPNLEFETIVIDSLDWLEPLIHQFICEKYKVDNLVKASGGYGNGYKEAFDMQVQLKNKLSIINEKKHVLLIAHSQVKQFNDPQTETAYDRFELKLHESSSVSPRGMWREFVDFMFFINKDVFTTGEGKSARATENGIYLYTSRTPAFDAKRRVFMPDKIKYETSGMFDLILSYFKKQDENLYSQVLSLADNCKDVELRKKAISELPKYRNDLEKLKEIQSFLEGK
jgi:hypothetical protein